MDPIVIATLCVGGIGCLSAVVLSVANKYISVKEDPRIGQVTGLLPGANCGGCGYAGCADYARAIVQNGASLTCCSVGGADVSNAIASALGRLPGETAEKKVAVVLCHGDCDVTTRRFGYNGITDCAAAQATAGGDKSCTYGCLGFGTCVRQCPAQALRIEKGIAKVEKRKCIGCGKCVEACPRKLIKLVPARESVHVFCSSKDKGPAVKKACGNGCLGCTLCTKLAPGAFVMQGALAVRDYGTPVQNEAVFEKCPGHCIARDA